MNAINASAGASAASQVYATRATYTADEQTAETTKTASDTVTLSDKARQAQNKWQELAANYDVHNMSASEMRSLSRELFDGGFIGTGEMMVIGAPTAMNEDPLKKHDLLNDMRHTYQLSSAMGGHSKESSELYLKSIEVLERLGKTRPIQRFANFS
ncbi:hypothetical protein [Pseudoalteromonas sp. R3]|uniref:hypothetical protein n=1 Tax=Pseudoalteromonas sp. R3 TaxID=1709477 RepID=UPI0006B5A7AC|nr:hypothetical protein [Pseudoalteromonas sp. R3]AZZ96929.1 hypothetical protein ELR70_07070 [Pseudoalteromonas sp. R3]